MILCQSSDVESFFFMKLRQINKIRIKLKVNQYIILCHQKNICILDESQKLKSKDIRLAQLEPQFAVFAYF